jgi:hypothetical protein
VRAVGAGEKLARNPRISRPDSKHHILVDANGVPVSAILTGANRNDVTQLLPLVDAIAPIAGTTPSRIAGNFANAVSSR